MPNSLHIELRPIDDDHLIPLLDGTAMGEVLQPGCLFTVEQHSYLVQQRRQRYRL